MDVRAIRAESVFWLKRLLVGLVLSAISVFLVIQLMVFCLLVWWKYYPVQTSRFMWDYQRAHSSVSLQHHWINDTDMGTPIRQALIVAEDARFTQHWGFDWEGMGAAMGRNITRGEVTAGGSTLTQQLAKNLFLPNTRAYWRKTEEAIITWMIERLWSKRRILEVYLNTIEFGEGVYGIEAAAQHYFQCHARQLTVEQAAWLAALVPNPVYYSAQQDARFQKHLNRIRRDMPLAKLPAMEKTPLMPAQGP